MKKALRFMFLSVAGLMMQHAWSSELNLPDMAETMTSSQLKKLAQYGPLREFLSGKLDDLSELDQFSDCAIKCSQASKDEESYWLGKLFLALQKQKKLQTNLTEKSRELRDAKSTQEMLQKEMLQKYKIALGCAGAFIVIDKLIIPLARKGCRVVKKMQNGQKRPNAWARLRSCFKREKSNA